MEGVFRSLLNNHDLHMSMNRFFGCVSSKINRVRYNIHGIDCREILFRTLICVCLIDSSFYLVFALLFSFSIKFTVSWIITAKSAERMAKKARDRVRYNINGIDCGEILLVPGSLRWRARNVLLGLALGAAVCFPLGWIHLKLVEKANEGNATLHSDIDQRGERKSPVRAAIDRLEGSLSK